MPNEPTSAEADRESGQRAFLLTWNPDKWSWEDFGQSVLATDGDGVIGERWSTGVRTSGIRIGDIVFLLRQGKRGRGIVGSGQATDFTGDSAPDDDIIYTDSHWDGSAATSNYVDVIWDRLVESDDRLPVEELEKDFPAQHWAPNGSGTQIRPEIVDALEARWSSHVAGALVHEGGQRHVADSKRRKAIENAAQNWLMQHHRDEGWEVRDTRYTGPYDAIATRNNHTLYLEAKGTQGSGEAVFVTRGEVEHARANPGHCIIGIWSGMRFSDDGEVDPRSGETIIMPFKPDTGILSALQYRWEWAAADKQAALRPQGQV